MVDRVPRGPQNDPILGPQISGFSGKWPFWRKSRKSRKSGKNPKFWTWRQDGTRAAQVDARSGPGSRLDSPGLRMASHPQKCSRDDWGFQFVRRHVCTTGELTPRAGKKTAFSKFREARLVLPINVCTAVLKQKNVTRHPRCRHAFPWFS